MLEPYLTLGENAQGVNTALALGRRLPALWVPEGALSGCLGVPGPRACHGPGDNLYWRA